MEESNLSICENKKKDSGTVPAFVQVIGCVISTALLILWGKEFYSFIHSYVSMLVGSSSISVIISFLICLIGLILAISLIALLLFIAAVMGIFVGYLMIGLGVLSFLVSLVIYITTEDIEVSFATPIYITVTGVALLVYSCLVGKYLDNLD